MLAGSAAVVAATVAGCRSGRDERAERPAPRRRADEPRSGATIDVPAGAASGGAVAEGGTVRLGTGPRAALLHVPAGSGSRRLVVCLHGAGGTSRAGLDLLLQQSDASGLVLVAPSSAGSTWDAITSSYGRDVATIEALLGEVVARTGVSLEGAAVAGFSDGASYALGLGLANGGLFGAVVAFSPGFVPPAPATGMPRVLISHGTGDAVLPIDATSRRIVPRLEAAGYDVTYREFEGGHEVPPSIVADAVAWLG